MSSPPSINAAAAATAMIQHKAPRKSASLPPETVEYLKAWMMSPEHVAHPYPTEQEKAQIMAETGIELKQLTNWFVNNRKRYWKPRVEAKLQKYQQPSGSTAGVGAPACDAVALPGGGLTIAVHHMNPKPQGSLSSFPVSSGNAASPTAPLFECAQSQAGLASHQPQAPAANFAPAVAGADALLANAVPVAIAAADHDDDPHTISEGSASSSPWNSDDDSVSSFCGSRRSAFGATAIQHVDPQRAESGSGANSGTAAASSSTVSSMSGGTGYRRHEEVDIHVLRPESQCETTSDNEPIPTLRDLTIKTSVPQDRILATFKCPISYTVPYEIEHDRKKVQNRRDGEVLRVKKHYLKLYLATRGIHSVNSPVGSDEGTCRSASENDKVPSDVSSAPSVAPAGVSLVASSSQAYSHDMTPLFATDAKVSTTSIPPSSRMHSISCTNLELLGRNDEEDTNPAPRKRARTASGSFKTGEDEWRSLCQNAKSLYCETLPSLEEAARMFGYVSQ